MMDVTSELVGRLLRQVLACQRGMREDIREVKVRLGRLETDVARLRLTRAEQTTGFDRFSDRVERIERRLEIGNA